jgi:protocatechuate 3,4-dioxygenase beta subunit
MSPPLTLPISRRDALIVLGTTGAVWLIGDELVSRRAMAAAGLSCIVRPEQTEGPYFLDERLNRSDIRSDPTTGHVTAGTPLTLTFHVMRFSPSGCQPLPHALVDVWHCDARGIYSDVEDPGFNTIGQKFLRGCQVTDAQGEARFLTIYPGWYPIRTVHIHFKIRTAPSTRTRYEFTSQVYFPDDLTDRVHAVPPYSSMGPRRVRNQRDFIFRDGGDRLVLAPTESVGGYTAAFSIGLQF